jgi:Bacterial regulatory proteins, gntR family/Aminotransferase class I and II
MPNAVRSLPLALDERPPHTTLTRWLYEELRRAILDRRLPHGTRLPATRDFAVQYGISRGTVVTVFEQLQAEGYLNGRAGAGTRVNAWLLRDVHKKRGAPPRIGKLPASLRGVPTSRPARPFRAYEPALTEFPTDIWARVAGRRLRRASSSLLAGGDPRGYAPLREAIAAYLLSSRGVNCSADSVVIVSGVQQGLDLVARLLIRPEDAICADGCCAASGLRGRRLRFVKPRTGRWHPPRQRRSQAGLSTRQLANSERGFGALGSEAGEVINLFALAIRSGMHATDLKHMLFAYPTSGSNMARML